MEFQERIIGKANDFDRINVQENRRTNISSSTLSLAFMMVDWPSQALGSSLAYISDNINPTLHFDPLDTPLILWMLISAIRGGIKIHNRDLAPLLEGNGWSLHHALHIPIWANDIFTKKPKLPKKHIYISQDKLVDFYTKIDPYFTIKYRFLFLLLAIFFILFYKNRMIYWLF